MAISCKQRSKHITIPQNSFISVSLLLIVVGLGVDRNRKCIHGFMLSSSAHTIANKGDYKKSFMKIQRIRKPPT